MAKRRVYWDSCAWIGFVSQEADKLGNLLSVYDDAAKGKIEIATSTVAVAESYRLGIEKDAPRPWTDSALKAFDDAFENDFVVILAVDLMVAKMARRFLRDTVKLRPADALHLATAAWHGIDEVHTFDGNLIKLDGKFDCRGGGKIKIHLPPLPNAGPLFEGSDESGG